MTFWDYAIANPNAAFGILVLSWAGLLLGLHIFGNAICDKYYASVDEDGEE